MLILIVLAVVSTCLYFFVGRAVIELAYEERLPGSLDFIEDALDGRDVHSVDHYQRAADRLFIAILVSGILLVILLRYVAAHKQEALLAVVSFILFFIIFDSSLRLFIRPTPHAYGSLFGRELPPYPLIPYEIIPTEKERSELHKTLSEFRARSGNALTYEDLSGRKREDDVLDHCLMENLRSPNDWFITNSLGARSEREFERKVPPGKFRILTFGDSYTAGEQVPQWETWTRKLETRSESLEVINFGSSGYGMGQSYRVYLRMREKLDYDLVIINFVPFADLYRDVNVLRYLPNRWNSFKPLARFVLDDGELQLIRSPYKNLSDMLRQNPDRPSRVLVDHLASYDPFYFPAFHEDRSIFRFSIFYKLYRSYQYKKAKADLFASIHEPGSEAMKICRKIFEQMDRTATKDSADFLLVLHPGEYGPASYRERGGFHTKWNRISRNLLEQPYRSFDLLPYLLEIPESEIDTGIDGTHYGPSTNEHISQALWQVIEPVVAKKQN